VDRERLKTLLSAKPLKFETANHSVAQLKKRVNDQQELIEYLAQCLSTQAASIIDIRKKMGTQEGAIEFLADQAGLENGPEPMIVMPDSKLVGFDS
jgi:hypothetical protein